MEPMKRCPQCGKSVAADRTYCMHCGVTIGIRCPECQTVSATGAKVCTSCGHSFVQRGAYRLSVRHAWQKNARPLLFALPILLLILTLIAAKSPAIAVTQSINDQPGVHHALSGYDLMRYFLNGNPTSVATLLGESSISEEYLPAVQALLFGAGLGWLLLVLGLILAICLVSCNLSHLGQRTGRRLFGPFGISLGASALLLSLGQLLAAYLVEILPTRAVETDVIVWKILAVAPLALFCTVACGFLLFVALYVIAVRHMEAEGELSMSRLFHIPVSAIGRVVRRAWHRMRHRRQASRASEEPYLTTTSRFSTFLVLLILALLFTQALLSKVSNIFFWFLFILPIVMLVYVLLAAHSLSVDMRTRDVTTEKNTPQTYEFRIRNRSILALPFIEAQLSIPQSNSVRCTERLARLSLAPRSSYTLKNTVTFRFRGTYEIGVRYFYVYDFFRLFCVRVDVDRIATVAVLPRRKTHDDALAQAVSDSTVRSVRAPLVVDKLEVSDMRDYRTGDALKSIHWKLSSKSEVPVVREYNTGTANQTVVFCDLAPHFPDEPPVPVAAEEAPRRRSARRQKRDAAYEKAPGSAADATGSDIPALSSILNDTRRSVDVHELSSPAYYEDMNEYLADGVVELTVAMVLSELRQGHNVLLLWFDRRAESGICAYPLRSLDEFEEIYRLFATAPLCNPAREGNTEDYDVTRLTALTGHLQSVKQLFVVPTLDSAMLTGLTSLPGVADAGNIGSSEVVLYSPEERFKYPAERASYLESCREQLAIYGISLTAGSFNITSATAPKGGASYEA